MGSGNEGILIAGEVMFVISVATDTGNNRGPVQKPLPHKRRLFLRTPPHLKKWLESTNQLGLRPQLMQFEEGSSLIILMQLGITNARR